MKEIVTDIPDEWNLKKWKDVLEIRNGRNQKEVIDENGKYPILGSAGKIMGYASDFICEAGTTIIGRKGSINNPLFIEERFWNVDTAFGLHTTPQLDKHYLHYFCLNFDFSKMDRGSGRPSLVKSDLMKIPIPIPPLSEQQQIVAILDKAFKAIDQAQANIEKNIENVKELFQSKLNEIFGQRGEGWEDKRLQDISLQFGRGKSKHRPRNDKKLFGGEYPFIQTGDIRNSDKIVKCYTQTYNEVGLSQSKLWPKGTICITIAANIAETAILDFDACFPDSVIGIIVDSSKANSDYAYYVLQYLKSELQAKGKGSAQDNINLGTFKTQFFPFPDLKIQELIVRDLDDLKINLNLLVEKNENKLLKIEDLKKSILQKAFAGKLTQTYEVEDSLDIAAEPQVAYSNSESKSKY